MIKSSPISFFNSTSPSIFSTMSVLFFLHTLVQNLQIKVYLFDWLFVLHKVQDRLYTCWNNFSKLTMGLTPATKAKATDSGIRAKATVIPANISALIFFCNLINDFSVAECDLCYNYSSSCYITRTYFN